MLADRGDAVVRRGDGRERRERELCPAPEADVPGDRLLDGQGCPRHAEEVDSALGVPPDGRVGAVDAGGGVGFHRDPRLLDGDVIVAEGATPAALEAALTGDGNNGSKR